MATITKTKPDYYKQSSSNDWISYSQGSFTCPTDWNLLFFQYQTAMGNITSCTFKFDVTSKKDRGQDTATFVFRFSATGVATGSFETKTVSVSGHYSGEISATFSFSGGLNIVPNISLNVYQSTSSNTFSITPSTSTITGTQSGTLSFDVDKRSANINDDVTISFNYRNDADITLTFRSYDYRFTPARTLTVNTATAKENTYKFSCDENWFLQCRNPNTYLYLYITATDTAGRTYTMGGSITVKREAITLDISSTDVPINSTKTITITDPYSRDLNVEIVPMNKSSIILLSDSGVKNSFSFSIPEDAFVTSNTYGQTLQIRCTFKDRYYREGNLFLTLTRDEIEVHLISFVDLSTYTSYVVTGYDFRLQFLRRANRELTVTFSSNGKTLKGILDVSQWIVNEDIAEFDCYKRWFDDANNVADTTIPFTITVTDEMLRRTVITHEIRAGSDMNPTVSAIVSPVQKASWPASLDTYYVQGYTRAKYEATVTAQTNAAITSVVLTSQRIGNLHLQYNSQTLKYEGETQAPLIVDTDYVITATDQRGLSASTQAATITVLPYNLPNISIKNYHRWRLEYTHVEETASDTWNITHNLNKNPDVVVIDENGNVMPCEVTYIDSNSLTCTFPITVAGTAYLGVASDDGDYCLMSVDYTFSPLNNLNEKETEVEVTGAQAPEPDSRTLPTYTATEVYLFAADIEHSYAIDITAADLLNSKTLHVVLSTAGVIMDFRHGGKGIGFGKVAEHDQSVEVNPEWTLRSEKIEVTVNNVPRDLSTLLATIMDKLDIS